MCGLLNVSFAAGLGTETGNLEKYLLSLKYGDQDDNRWKPPSAQNLIDFASAFDHVLAGEYVLADQFAANAGYEVVQFIDTAHGPAHTYYLLQDVNAVPHPNASGGGTYVVNPVGRPVVIQAPHPVSDRYTGEQAIEALFTVGPRILMLAGTRRKSAKSISSCTGDHRASDVVHTVDNYFYTAHERASRERADTIFVQLHGFGTTSLKKLKKQCGVKTQRLVNLSEGVDRATDPSAATFMHTLRRRLDADKNIKACIFGNDTESLGGTTNTTGRLTNGSLDPCLANATTSSMRFVHVEQSYPVRSELRDVMAEHLQDAVRDYFP